MAQKSPWPKSHIKFHYQRPAIFTAALMLILAGSNCLSLAASAATAQTWTFEEALENRKKYEPLVDALCNYDNYCEMTAYNQYRDDGDLDGYSVGILNGHPLLLTAFQPETGAIKLYLNDRASILYERLEGGSYGVYAPVKKLSITWKFTDSDQTYVFTDHTRLIPQQEIDLLPEDLVMPEGSVLKGIDITLETHATIVYDKVDASSCLKDKTYVVGKQCSVVINSRKGPQYLPTGEIAVEPPTTYPVPDSQPYVPTPDRTDPTSPDPTDPDPDPDHTSDPELDSSSDPKVEDKEDHGEDDDHGTSTSPLPPVSSTLPPDSLSNPTDFTNQEETTENPLSHQLGQLDILSTSNNDQNNSSTPIEKLPLAPNTGAVNEAEPSQANENLPNRPMTLLFVAVGLATILGIYSLIRALLR